MFTIRCQNGRMLAQFDPLVLEAVGRASKRSSSVVHEDMKAGLYDLATIASIAPWFGIFGTIAGIVNSFPGVEGQRSSGLAVVFKGLSTAMCFTALGLLVGLVALWSYEYLAARLRSLDLEMENASKELLNQLSRFPGDSKLDQQPSSAPPAHCSGNWLLRMCSETKRIFAGAISSQARRSLSRGSSRPLASSRATIQLTCFPPPFCTHVSTFQLPSPSAAFSFIRFGRSFCIADRELW